MVNLKLNEKQTAILTETYIEQKDRKMKEMQVLQVELHEIEEILAQLGSGVSNTSVQDAIAHADGYKQNSTWLRKVEHIIRKIGPSTTSDIVKVLINNYEPNMLRQTAVRSISSTLSQHCGHGKLFSKKLNDRGDNVYYIEDRDETSTIDAGNGDTTVKDIDNDTL